MESEKKIQGRKVQTNKNSYNKRTEISWNKKNNTILEVKKNYAERSIVQEC